jgi:hypothetical protein
VLDQLVVVIAERVSARRGHAAAVSASGSGSSEE